MSLGPAPCVREACTNMRAAACRARVPPPPLAPDICWTLVCDSGARARSPRAGGTGDALTAPGSAATATQGRGHYAPRMIVRGAKEAREAARNAARFTAAAGSSAVGASLCKATGARSRAAAAAAGGGMGMPSCVARVAVFLLCRLLANRCPSPLTYVMFDQGHT